MQVEVLFDAEAVAGRGAALIAAEARAAVAARGIFTLAVSGGETPWIMLRKLAGEDVPWPDVRIFQVDERVAPEGDLDRNLTHLRECLIDNAPIGPAQFYPMPVEAPELPAGAAQYEDLLRALAGSPPVLDLVQLGIGVDGHTGSLLPDDPVLDLADADVGLSRPYHGRRRMTLTYPALNRARRVLWLVTGDAKARVLARLRAGDRSMPAGRVRQEHALVLADRAAAGKS